MGFRNHKGLLQKTGSLRDPVVVRKEIEATEDMDAIRLKHFETLASQMLNCSP